MSDILKFSVVIPVYNGSNTVTRAVDSCLKQTTLPWEIIIVNDCSKDNTLDVLIENYQGNNIVKIYSLPKNSGVSVARNLGWDKATGDFIAFLDADDVWHPSKLEVLNELKHGYKDVSCIAHKYTENSLSEEKKIMPKCKILKFRHFLIRNYFNTSCLAVCKCIGERFNETMRYTEDHDLCLRIANKMNIYYIDLPLTSLGRPQLSKGGLSGNQWAMRKGEMKLYFHACKLRWWLFPCLPLFFLFSIAKHLLKLGMRCMK